MADIKDVTFFLSPIFYSPSSNRKDRFASGTRYAIHPILRNITIKYKLVTQHTAEQERPRINITRHTDQPPPPGPHSSCSLTDHSGPDLVEGGVGQVAHGLGVGQWFMVPGRRGQVRWCMV